MLLRNPISSTRNFFRKTLGSLKSLFSVGERYQKLPKSTPLYTPLSGSITAGQLISDIQQITSKVMENTSPTMDGYCESSSTTTTKTNSEENKKKNKVKRDVIEGIMVVKNKKLKKKKNNILVEQKLKELELLDMSNVDHVLDIEEVLHYYSRLTCPAYIHIVDTFFDEILAEFLGSSTPIHTLNSELRFNSETNI